MRDEPGSPDCRLVIDAKRSLEDVLRLIADLPHTDHMRRQLLSVYNQLEGMHDLKRSGGRQCVVSFCRLEFFGEVIRSTPIRSSVAFRCPERCLKTTDVRLG